MAKSFKYNDKDIIFDETKMVAEKITDAETNEVTGYAVISHYLDESDTHQQIIYKINEKTYKALIK